MRVIEIVLQSSLVSEADAAACVAALQRQVTEHFEPAYPGLGCTLQLAVADPAAPHTPSVETIYLLDHSDQAGALGYHTETTAGVPVGYAFMAETIADGEPWQSTVSHELLEQLLDPYADLTVPVRLSSAFGRDAGRPGMVAFEACDPCENDLYEVNGIPLSNFILPAWFDGASSKVDFLGKLPGPLTLDSGGYISYAISLTGWKQVTAREDFEKHAYARFHRRRRRHKVRRAAV